MSRPVFMSLVVAVLLLVCTRTVTASVTIMPTVSIGLAATAPIEGIDGPTNCWGYNNSVSSIIGNMKSGDYDGTGVITKVPNPLSDFVVLGEILANKADFLAIGRPSDGNGIVEIGRVVDGIWTVSLILSTPSALPFVYHHTSAPTPENTGLRVWVINSVSTNLGGANSAKDLVVLEDDGMGNQTIYVVPFTELDMGVTNLNLIDIASVIIYEIPPSFDIDFAPRGDLNGSIGNSLIFTGRTHPNSSNRTVYIVTPTQHVYRFRPEFMWYGYVRDGVAITSWTEEVLSVALIDVDDDGVDDLCFVVHPQSGADHVKCVSGADVLDAMCKETFLSSSYVSGYGNTYTELCYGFVEDLEEFSSAFEVSSLQDGSEYYSIGSIANIGDHNGDNHNDLAVAYIGNENFPAGHSLPSYLYVFLLAIADEVSMDIAVGTMPTDIAAFRYESPSNRPAVEYFFDGPISGPGDWNGDCYADIIVGSVIHNEVYIIKGGPIQFGSSIELNKTAGWKRKNITYGTKTAFMNSDEIADQYDDVAVLGLNYKKNGIVLSPILGILDIVPGPLCDTSTCGNIDYTGVNTAHPPGSCLATHGTRLDPVCQATDKDLYYVFEDDQETLVFADNFEANFEVICLDDGIWSAQKVGCAHDPCEENPCSNGGTCQNLDVLEGTYSCECAAGYLLTDDCSVESPCPNCDVADPCTTDECKNGATCTSTYDETANSASATCTCDNTWTGTYCDISLVNCSATDAAVCANEGKDCEPNDQGVAQCISYCHTTKQDFCSAQTYCRTSSSSPYDVFCECPIHLYGDRCQYQYTRCDESPCATDASCIEEGNTGLASCNCSSSAGTGRFCTETFTSCSDNVGICNLGGCIDDNTYDKGFYCECTRSTLISAFGEFCEHVACEENRAVCASTGTCYLDDQDISVEKCHCLPLYSGDMCEVQEDPCSSSPCVNGNCKLDLNTGIATCDCHENFSGPTCDSDIYSCPCDHGDCIADADEEICVCHSGWTGDWCISRCIEDYCKNGGTCSTDNEEPMCHCMEGFQGDTCEEHLSCDDTRCNAGNCTDLGNGEVKCFCPEGFSGDYCDLTSENACYNDPCGAYGVCKEDAMDGFTCDCDSGYEGEMCVQNIDDCVNVDCSNRGNCVDDVGFYRCDCYYPTKRSGRDCEFEIYDTGSCTQYPCGEEGTCSQIDFSSETGRDYECTCSDAYKGVDCLDPRDDCSLQDRCSNGGICYDGPIVVEFTGMDSICDCEGTGYTGFNCKEEKDDVCEGYCVFGECVIDIHGERHCICETDRDGDAAYYGETCDTRVTTCSSEPCNGGVCEVAFFSATNANGFVCNCTGTGLSGDTCTEGPACEDNPCENNGTCIQTSDWLETNQFYCQCTVGFHGDICTFLANETVSDTLTLSDFETFGVSGDGLDLAENVIVPIIMVLGAGGVGLYLYLRYREHQKHKREKAMYEAESMDITESDLNAMKNTGQTGGDPAIAEHRMSFSLSENVVINDADADAFFGRNDALPGQVTVHADE